MIKKDDITYISKQLKISDKSNLNVNDVYFGFMRSGENTPLYSEVKGFYDLDDSLQELLMKNLKKVYSGNLNVKIFNPQFLESELNDEESFASIIKEIEKDIDFHDNCDTIAEKILSETIMKDNMMLIIASCTIYKDNESRHLIIGTICKTKIGEQNFIFKGDLQNVANTKYQFLMQSSLDSTINLKSAVDGFSFPVLTEGQALRNQVIYYSNKSNNIDIRLVGKVLGCEVELTAKQEKEMFETLLGEVSGDSISAKDLYSIYLNLDNFDEETPEEEKIVSLYEVKKSLKKLNINLKLELEDALEGLCGLREFNFKLMNIIPNKDKKSISISNDDADIKVKPDSLKNLKQVQDENGQVYLMVPLSEKAVTNGLVLPIEKFEEE